MLAAFVRVHPDVEITARYGRSVDNLEAVTKLDLAVVFERQQYSMVEALMTDPTVWVTQDAHRMHACRPAPIALSDSRSWCT